MPRSHVPVPGHPPVLGAPIPDIQLTTDRAELMRTCQGLVRSLAWKIHQKVLKRVELDDLIGYGQVGLAEAARDFDAERGLQFTTYAYYRIRGSILDGLSRMSWFSRADYARGCYEKTAHDVLVNDAQAPRDHQDSVEWFGETTSALSMAYMISNLQGGAEQCESREVTPFQSAEAADLRETIRELIAGLDDRERELITRVYFDGESIKTAGEHLGISKAWASRLHARCLIMLGERLRDRSE